MKQIKYALSETIAKYNVISINYSPDIEETIEKFILGYSGLKRDYRFTFEMLLDSTPNVKSINEFNDATFFIQFN